MALNVLEKSLNLTLSHMYEPCININNIRGLEISIYSIRSSSPSARTLLSARSGAGFPHLQGVVQVFHGVIHEGALLPTLSLHRYYRNIIKFVSAFYHVCVTGQLLQHSTVNLLVKVQYI